MGSIDYTPLRASAKVKSLVMQMTERFPKNRITISKLLEELDSQNQSSERTLKRYESSALLFDN